MMKVEILKSGTMLDGSEVRALRVERWGKVRWIATIEKPRDAASGEWLLRLTNYKGEAIGSGYYFAPKDGERRPFGEKWLMADAARIEAVERVMIGASSRWNRGFAIEAFDAASRADEAARRLQDGQARSFRVESRADLRDGGRIVLLSFTLPEGQRALRWTDCMNGRHLVVYRKAPGAVATTPIKSLTHIYKGQIFSGRRNLSAEQAHAVFAAVDSGDMAALTKLFETWDTGDFSDAAEARGAYEQIVGKDSREAAIEAGGAVKLSTVPRGRPRIHESNAARVAAQRERARESGLEDITIRVPSTDREAWRTAAAEACQTHRTGGVATVRVMSRWPGSG